MGSLCRRGPIRLKASQVVVLSDPHRPVMVISDCCSTGVAYVICGLLLLEDNGPHPTTLALKALHLCSTILVPYSPTVSSHFAAYEEPPDAHVPHTAGSDISQLSVI